MFLSRPVFDFILGTFFIAMLDSVGAILSNKLKFKYVLLLPISLAVYVYIGFLLGKTSNYPTTCFYAGLLGLFDATIGLRLSIYFDANFGISKERVDQLKGRRTSIHMILVGVLFCSLGFIMAGFS